jgi:hypothetical protein
VSRFMQRVFFRDIGDKGYRGWPLKLWWEMGLGFRVFSLLQEEIKKISAPGAQ